MSLKIFLLRLFLAVPVFFWSERGNKQNTQKKNLHSENAQMLYGTIKQHDGI